MWTSRAPEARAREVGVDSLEVGVGVVWWLGCDEDGGDEEEDDEDEYVSLFPCPAVVVC